MEKSDFKINQILHSVNFMILDHGTEGAKEEGFKFVNSCQWINMAFNRILLMNDNQPFGG